MLKIAICDNEKDFRKRVKTYIEQYLLQREIPFMIDIYSSGKEFLELGIDFLTYSIVFLEMDGAEGIETARQIRKWSSEIFLVFESSYIEYALEGYKVDAVRYLLKNSANFPEAIEECMDVILEKKNRIIMKKRFKFRQGEREISLERIIYRESRLHRLEFHVIEEDMEVYTMYGTLNELEEEMRKYEFLRIHQSYLVNLKYVKKIVDYKAVLDNGQILNIPKVIYKEVKAAFMRYKREV